MEGRVRSWMDQQFEAQDRRVQGYLDAFESSITQQLGTEQISNIANVKAEITEIKKMVIEQYERSVVIEPVMETEIPTVEVHNILADSVDAQVKKTREERKRKKRKAKRAEKKAKLKSIQDEQDCDTGP